MPGRDGDRVYAFESWEVDLGRRELRAAGVPVPIGGRAFEIIEALVEASGELVTKHDLMERVWPGAIIEENTLQVHISAVRRAFGRDRGMLKTASGRGYRLLGTWTVREGNVPPSQVPPPAPSPMPPHANNLPVAGSDLIGRVAAILHLRDVISAYRAVTLTGPGGIGKTRLALEVAHHLSSGFRDGIWLVELASLTDPAFVPATVAAALCLGPDIEEMSPQSIARAIGARNLLMLIDNCEHVVDAAAGLAETIIRTCPNVSILATSRELLRIDGEHAYRVPPLDVPPRDADASDDLLQHSAVQLFIARTRALSSGLLPHQQDLPAVAAICRRLDGIPLAIELAAARAATLGLEPVLSRLDERFGLLTHGRRTALPQHQTLRATLDWSYELLPDTERYLLRWLAIFPAGFSLEAAIAVVSDATYAACAVTDGIANLVAKSLLSLDESAATSRWRLLETTRAYALAKLEENAEAAAAARRHATFFRDLFAPANQISLSAQRLLQYGREIDNIRAALDWAFSKEGDTAIGVVLTAAYLPVWVHLSLPVECRERAERALDSLEPRPSLSPRLMMQLHIELGVVLVFTLGLIERTAAVLAKGLAMAEDLNDTDYQLRALWAMWTLHYNVGRINAAQPIAEKFQTIATATRFSADTLVGDRLLGNTMHLAGDQPRARHLLENLLDRYAPPDDQRHAIWLHYDQRVLARAILARVLWLQGYVEQATDHAHLSLEAARTVDDRLSLPYALAWGVCPLAFISGDLDAAERSVATLVELAGTHSMPFWRSLGWCLEGRLLIERGNYSAGSVALRNGLDAFGRTGWVMCHPEFLGTLAAGLAGMGRLAEATEAVDEALAPCESDGQRWCLAELHRTKGEILLRQAGRQSTPAAESCFFASIEEARRQGALFWELRAALSIARLRLRQGRPGDARDMLAPVYDRFTEGFDFPDLRDAKTFIAALPGR